MHLSWLIDCRSITSHINQTIVTSSNTNPSLITGLTGHVPYLTTVLSFSDSPLPQRYLHAHFTFRWFFATSSILSSLYHRLASFPNLLNQTSAIPASLSEHGINESDTTYIVPLKIFPPCSFSS